MIKIQTADRWYIGLGLGLSLVGWVLFKLIYPNPNIVFDSYYYIYAAVTDASAPPWPIGYSKFLQGVGWFSHSVDLVLALQYFFLQSSFLCFFCSLRSFFRLGKWAGIILFVFLMANPIYCFTCNFVLSDALFLAISLLWLTSLLWMLRRPRPGLLLVHAVLLFIAFTIRQSALVYPLVSCLALLLSPVRWWLRIAGILVPGIFIGVFILYTSQANFRLYGQRQFSPFQSWKVASNALYAYAEVAPAQRKPVPPSFQGLDKMVRRYFDAPHQPVSILTPDPSSGSYYMFMWDSPLLIYRNKQYGSERAFAVIDPATLAKLGPLYREYGSWLIRQYPLSYLQHFVLPNVYIYFLPHAEVYTEEDNPFQLQPDTLGSFAVKWFGPLSLSAPANAIHWRTALLSWCPLINFYTHLFFLISSCWFLLVKGFRRMSVAQKKAIFLVGGMWLINFGFIILATASLLRYQLFIVVVEFAFAVVLVDTVRRKISGIAAA